MLGGIDNIPRVPELRKRLLITVLLLAVYRVGVAVPTPGIDARALADFFARAEGTIFGLFNLFSGGALERFSVFTLGIMPYISASIILQLLTVVFPYLEKLQKEGEMGRRKINQYTRYGTIGLSLIQSFLLAYQLERTRGEAGQSIVLNPGWSFRLMTALTLTCGTSFLMWLGEQITERGIGNGISLIIYAGIVARIPSAMANTVRLMRSGDIGLFSFLFVIAIMVFVIAAIIFMERGQRRIPIQYARRIVGRRVYGGQSTHLPLRINTSGVIPPIFASSLLMIPITAASMIQHPWVAAVTGYLSRGNLIYNSLYVLLIVFFAYFYTAVIFNPVDVADNLRKFGGYIPGIRPGGPTSEYLDRVLTRITLWGALYVAAVCVLPSALGTYFNVPFYYGGTSLLIVVGVALDTIQQIETHMIMRHYEGFMQSGRIKGRMG